MNLFKKLFGKVAANNEPLPEKKIASDNTADLEELENMVRPLMRNATKIIVASPSKPVSDSNMKSQFGGMPYFESSEVWPKSKEGNHLNFIFQLFNGPDIELPENIKLVQFFYDLDEMPWSSDDDGWLVKIYETLDNSKVLIIDKPSELPKSKYCEISLESVKSLPDWEGLEVFNENVSELASKIDEDKSWEIYDELVYKLTGQDDYQSQLGGYPRWVQGEGTPQNKDGEDFRLLFQIDSEENAGLMWGDSGLIYVFYDEKSKDISLELQCY